MTPRRLIALARTSARLAARAVARLAPTADRSTAPVEAAAETEIQPARSAELIRALDERMPGVRGFVAKGLDSDRHR